MVKAMSEWIVYKNDFRIGQAKTWHKALDILIQQEGLTSCVVVLMSHYITVRNNEDNYRIVNERGQK